MAWFFIQITPSVSLWDLLASVPLFHERLDHSNGPFLKLGSFLAIPGPTDSTRARVTLVSNYLAALSIGRNILGRSSALLRPLLGGRGSLKGEHRCAEGWQSDTLIRVHRDTFGFPGPK